MPELPGFVCPHCGERIEFHLITQHLGKRTSERKAAASRENGKKGGAPRKQPQPTQESSS